MKEIRNDILIIGGGLTGLLAAYTFSRLGLNICILDKFNFFDQTNNKADLRTTAVAEGSKEFFEKINIWAKLNKDAQLIKQIKVINRTEANILKFKNKKINNNLGYIIRNSLIKKSLIKLIKGKKNILIFQNILINKINKEDDFIYCETNKIKFISKLLVAADGKNSFVRQNLKIKKINKKYNHKAIVVNFNHNKDHENTAHELFFKTGPLAILPMKKFKKNVYTSSIIWSNSPAYIDSLKDLKRELLILILEENIKKYTGSIAGILDVQTFELSAHINEKFYDDRVVFLGDSAHSIHPIAGQGWNIGIRDIESIYSVLKNNLDLGLDIGCNKVCKDYHDLSYYDAFSLFQITDKLNSIFMNDSWAFKIIRNQGFKYINNNNFIKNYLTNFAMGF